MARSEKEGSLIPQLLAWWRIAVPSNAPWDDVDVRACFETDTHGAVVSDGVDPITLLRHRVSWVVTIEGGRITKIVAPSSRVPDVE